MKGGNGDELFTCNTGMKGCRRKLLAVQNKLMHTDAKLQWTIRMPEAFLWAVREIVGKRIN